MKHTRTLKAVVVAAVLTVGMTGCSWWGGGSVYQPVKTDIGTPPIPA